MYLTSLEIRNFMPFKGDHQMVLPEDRGRNVVLVFGDNMRGKTSLLNALRWVFYGTAIDRYGADIPLQRLVNVDAAVEGDWEIDVKVTFTHGEKAYVLSRSARRNRGVGTPQRPEDFIVETTLLQDGQVMRGDQVTHIINQIVPQQISRFFLFDGELLQEYESLLADDDEQGRRIKDAIEQVLGVPALVQGKDDLRLLRKPFDKQMAQDLRQYEHIKHFTEKLAQLGRESEDLEASKIQLTDALAGTKKQYQELQQKVDAAEARFAQRRDLDNHVEARKRIADEQKSLEARSLDVVRDSWKDLLRPGLSQKLKDLQDAISTDSEMIVSETARSHRHDLIDASLKAGVCNLCEKPLDDATEGLRAELEQSKRKVDVGAASIRMAEANRLARRLSEIRYPQAKTVIAEISASALRLAVEDTKLNGEIDRLKDELANFDNDEMVRTRKAAINAHHAIRQLESRLEEVVRKLEENRSSQDKMRLVINENKNARDQRSSRIVNLVSSLEKAFSSAIGKLRDDLRSDIEQKATASFKSLTTDASYRGLTINNNYGLTIVDEHGRNVSLRSAGAEQIVALSLIDGLNQTGRSAGPVIMDTPFGRLDPKHRGRVLRHLPTSALQVVLFVHEGEVDRVRDLVEVAPRIGAIYSLDRISSSQTRLVKV
ncbi:MAG: AAA family ATPase [Lysobacter sp.]|nr:AAA family ATPase [Lysobacter sp.]